MSEAPYLQKSTNVEPIAKSIKVCFDTLDFWVNGVKLELNLRETQVLNMLCRYKGFTCPKEKLLSIWTESYTEQDEKCLRNVIYKLRKILGYKAIKTRKFIGYYLAIDVIEVKL